MNSKKRQDEIRLDNKVKGMCSLLVSETRSCALLSFGYHGRDSLSPRSGIGRGGTQKCGGPYGCVRRVRDFFFPALRRKKESNFIVNAATNDISSTRLMTANSIRTLLIKVGNTWRFACYLVRT